MILAARGLREREQGGVEAVDDADERRRLARQAFRVHAQAFVVAAALTSILMFIRVA